MGKHKFFQVNPRHVTPQINCLGKTSSVLRLSTHIYSASKDIDGKTVNFSSKHRDVTPQINCLGKMSTVLRTFNTHLWGFSGDKWENIHFWSKPRHVDPSDHLWKTSHVLRVSTHIFGVSKEIDGKTFIFRVNLGMWPLKSIVSEKQAMFWGFQHTFIVFPRT